VSLVSVVHLLLIVVLSFFYRGALSRETPTFCGTRRDGGGAQDNDKRNASPPAVLPNFVKIGRLFQKCSGAPEDNTVSLHLLFIGSAAR
jgi:hypothetical protein